MWVRLDDALTEHPKLFRAASKLAPHGFSRVLSLMVQGICYANRNLTDGWLPRAVVARFHDHRPLQVATVLSDESIKIWERRGEDFYIHDYEKYQPSAAEIKAKREQDRLRKSGRNPDGIRLESPRIPERSRARDPDPSGTYVRPGEDHASSCDSEGTISAPPSVSPPPLTSRHSTIHAPGAMAGALPRAHRTHVWCAFVDGRYRGVCVPDTLHAQFVGQHGGDPEDADTKLKAWYESVVRSIPVDTPIGDDVFTFWRLNFTARFGAIAPPPPTANERRRQLAEQTPLGVPARDNIP